MTLSPPLNGSTEEGEGLSVWPVPQGEGKTVHFHKQSEDCAVGVD